MGILPTPATVLQFDFSIHRIYDVSFDGGGGDGGSGDVVVGLNRCSMILQYDYSTLDAVDIKVDFVFSIVRYGVCIVNKYSLADTIVIPSCVSIP